MMEFKTPQSAFSVPDLWRPSVLTVGEDDDTRLFPPLELDSERAFWMRIR
jgi:hypothetical protein